MQNRVIKATISYDMLRIECFNSVPTSNEWLPKTTELPDGKWFMCYNINDIDIFDSTNKRLDYPNFARTPIGYEDNGKMWYRYYKTNN